MAIFIGKNVDLEICVTGGGVYLPPHLSLIPNGGGVSSHLATVLYIVRVYMYDQQLAALTEGLPAGGQCWNRSQRQMSGNAEVGT